MNKGFTLVELSIVLVIVGLLIGGILIAQSMMKTARVQTHIRTLQQYEISMNNFALNYRAIPGDSPYVSPPGNNNGVLDSNGVCSSTSPYSGAEQYNLWMQLSETSMIKDKYVGWSPMICGGTQPNSTNGSNIIGVSGPIFTTMSEYTPIRGTTKVEVQVSKSSSTPLTILSCVLDDEAKSMDIKMDDGAALTGNFRPSVFVGKVSSFIYYVQGL